MRKIIMTVLTILDNLLTGLGYAATPIFLNKHSVKKVFLRHTHHLQLDFLLTDRDFFVLRDPRTGRITYTRDGVFTKDGEGYFIQDGLRLQGYGDSSEWRGDSSYLIDLKAPPYDLPPQNGYAGGHRYEEVILEGGTLLEQYTNGLSIAIGKVAIAF